MSKEMREQINKIKNFRQFLNEDIVMSIVFGIAILTVLAIVL